MIKSYKGFNRDMTCHGKKYEEGKDYEEPKANAGKCRMHACEYPLDAFGYYQPCQSVYHEVTQDGEISKSSVYEEISSTRMHIGGRLNIRGLVSAAIEYTRSKIKSEYKVPYDYGVSAAGECDAATVENYGTSAAGSSGCAATGNHGVASAGNHGAATTGEYGVAAAGNYGAAAAENYGAAISGEYGAAAAGDHGVSAAGESGAATTGECGVAAAGNYGIAATGECGVAAAGNYGAANTGECGVAASRGWSSSGVNGLSVARGAECRVKGDMGAILVIAEEDEYSEHSYDIVAWKAVVVDGDTIKPNTWYTLKNGEFIECETDESDN